MASKVIHTRTDEQGVLSLTVEGLPPGEIEVILNIPDAEIDRQTGKNVGQLPLGGYKAGWLEPEQLRRKILYS
jgi:hypothetical protein